jgi:hypothetical protein
MNSRLRTKRRKCPATKEEKKGKRVPCNILHLHIYNEHLTSHTY